MKRWLRPLACSLLLLSTGLWAQESKGFVYLASTIGPIDSGVVEALENAFEKETGIRVRHVGAGTGAALDISKQGIGACYAHVLNMVSLCWRLRHVAAAAC